MDKQMLDYNIRVRLPIILVAVVVAYFATFFAGFKERNMVGYAPEQPIKFSHKLHAGDLGMDCRYCHTAAEKGRHAGVPSTDTCMNCHSVARADMPEIKKLKEYFDSNEPIPWVRIHKTPDFVYFNHSVHLASGIDCAQCHGDVAGMDVVQRTKPLSMGWCLECHRTPQEQLIEVTGPDNQKSAQLVRKHAGGQHCSACHR
ncbi:MAG: cytochrome c3 family protein [Candidatus Cloacimonetes bacterium]|nr:cytochrome c3 family protein [Candidatus Cloacimonadota bacterium]